MARYYSYGVHIVSATKKRAVSKRDGYNFKNNEVANHILGRVKNNNQKDYNMENARPKFTPATRGTEYEENEGAPNTIQTTSLT